MKWIIAAALLLGATPGLRAAGVGDSVVVVFNKNLPESKQLAEYYAEKRGVPAGQLFGVDVNAASEVMTRAQFRDQLQNPIFKWLVREKLFTPNPKKKKAADTEYRTLINAKVRYLVLCYGVPLKISRDTTLKEDGADKVQEPLRGRNEAAVDADLAVLPVSQEQFPLTGPVGNPFYLGTNAFAMNPTNGLLMVARLDGPTAAIARGLVDKALEAEANGLWGRAYFDSRGITNGEYKPGDDWMRTAALITERLGFHTTLDKNEATFDAAFPMSQIAFYAGWYDQNVSGPLARPSVEFMPGAFAYHLHSYSANTLRSATAHWVGPLLMRGATITFGCVDEPYLTGTPNVAAFLDRLIYRRWTFGEAAYGCQASLSWQTTVIGDPLYAPFAMPPDQLHFKLEREHSPLLEWSHERVVGLNHATGLGAPDLIKYLADIPLTTNSAVLLEKLGDLQRENKRTSAACEAYAAAVKQKPSPQQKIRLLLTLGELNSLIARDQEAFNAYQQLVTEAPEYPKLGPIYQHLADLSRTLGKKDDAEKFAKEATRLAAPKP